MLFHPGLFFISSIETPYCSTIITSGLDWMINSLVNTGKGAGSSLAILIPPAKVIKSWPKEPGALVEKGLLPPSK